MATPSQWIAGTRPRTLPAALVPVAVALAIAHATGTVHLLRLVLTLLVSLLIQIGTNFANDYSDGVRGTDEERAGPQRLVGGRLASPRSVLSAALGCFLLAAVLGLVAALLSSLWVLLVGAAAIAAGWFYTGGRHPYGYFGYGELFVFVFFGPVSVLGSTYVISGSLPALASLAAIPVGLLTVALLVVNNLRDIPTDLASGKRTLAVKIGDTATRSLYLALVAVSFLMLLPIARWRHFALLALLALPLARGPIRAIRTNASGRGLIPALAGTGTLLLGTGALLALGIAI